MSKRFEWRKPTHRRYALRALVVVAIVVGAALGVSQARVSEHHQARPNSPHFMRVGEGQFATSLNAVRTGEPAGADGLNQEIYSNQAYPALTIAPAQRQAAAAAAAKIKTKPAKKKAAAGCWSAPPASRRPRPSASESTAGTSGTVFSGRDDRARGLVGLHLEDVPDAAGSSRGRCLAHGQRHGQEAPSGSSPTGRFPPTRSARSRIDPNDTTGKTVYVGTGEPNGSSDSEAGVGLYKSLDGGQTWTRVFGSVAPTAPCSASPSSLTCPVATGRSIGAIAVDPADPTTSSSARTWRGTARRR